MQGLLGHTSIMVTADTYTYTSVLPDVQRRCADATAALVLSAARHTRKRIKEAAKNRPVGRDEQQTPSGKRPASKRKNRTSRSRRHIRHHAR
jgi:hypothetical protein